MFSGLMSLFSKKNLGLSTHDLQGSVLTSHSKIEIEINLPSQITTKILRYESYILWEMDKPILWIKQKDLHLKISKLNLKTEGKISIISETGKSLINMFPEILKPKKKMGFWLN